VLNNIRSWDETLTFTESAEGYVVIQQSSTSLLIALKCSTDDDKATLLDQLRQISTGESSSSAYDRNKNQSNIVHVLNLVRNKQIPGAKRGARVKSMALCSRHSFLYIFKPLLILALESFFAEPSDGLLEKLFTAINSIDTDMIPALSVNEKQILRGGDVTLLFPNHLDSCATGPLFIPFRLNRDTPAGRITFDGNRFAWETKVLFEKIPIPVKIPIDMYPGELGDVRYMRFDISLIIVVFHYSFHQHVSSSWIGKND
jgi:hypothetical protein